MKIIDAHIHIFDRIDGRSINGNTSSDSCGRMRVGEKLRPFIPPSTGVTSYPVEVIEELLDRHGVDKAVLLQNPTIGIVNREVAGAIARAPHRFAGVVQVDPCAPDAAETIREYGEKPGFRALKFEMSRDWGWSGILSDLSYTGDAMRKAVRTAAELGLHVMIDTGACGNPGYDLDGIETLMDAHPDTVFQLEHLGFLTPPDEGNPLAMASWDRFLALGLRPNVYIGYASVGILLNEEHPCPKAVSMLETAVARIGAEKILWGSDAPVTLTRYTYRQMIDGALVHARLDERQRALIMGGNAERLYFGV